MVYVALLRGINVGGKHTVAMALLKKTFENLGFNGVKTYINSGNVIFSSSQKPLAEKVEAAIEKDFGFRVPVVVRTFQELETLVKGIPAEWVNDTSMRCDVMFLWPAVDRPEVIQQFPFKPELEDVIYLPGAVVWRIDRSSVRRGAIPKIIGTNIYKQLTIRNVNTTRKLYELMKS